MDLYPEPPGTKTEDAKRFFAALGGSSANIAVGLVRLGASADLVTCISDDAIGRYCLGQLASYGVGCDFVRSVGGQARNSLGIVETTVEDHQSVIYRNGAADFLLDIPDIEKIAFSDYAAVVATGTALAAQPSRDAVLLAFRRAREAGVPVIFDIDYRPYSWTSADVAAATYAEAAELSDVVVGNDLEFGFVAGDYESGLERARQLVADGAALAIYKMGEQGAISVTADGEFRSGIFRSHALKPTGAGDSFLAGLIASLAEGVELADAVRRGSAAAAIVVSRVGCAPAMPFVDELDALCQEAVLMSK